MSVAIRVEGLSKRYVLRHQRHGRYTALRDVLAEGAKNLGRRLLGRAGRGAGGAPDREPFWALRDVSFEVEEGTRLGIIGRNGAGKSTLLKLLSRVTEPTAGRITLRGRVSSLLEVGTGFHPELTGRENIYLNGSILGMRLAEIRRKFDEIVAFAEVERFLDTPVKRYSSGMYVRLAFSVAAHLEPEILVVDEVLAVGDAQFQKKCLGKMEEVGRGGRTVLFVSHNMNAVDNLCSSCLLLEDGQLKSYSSQVREVIKAYLTPMGNQSTSAWINDGTQLQNSWFTPTRVAFVGQEGLLRMPVSNDREIWVEIEGDVGTLDPALQVGYALYSGDGSLLYWTCHTDMAEEKWPVLGKGSYLFRSRIPRRFLNEGSYRVELLCALYYRTWISQPGVNAPSVHLEIQGGLSDSPYWMVCRPGILAPEMEWHALKLGPSAL